jgi:hypothetical protein
MMTQTLIERLRHEASLRAHYGDPILEEAADAIEALKGVLDDKHRLARELDIAMHGEQGVAAQASLCDLIEPARRLREKLEAALMDARERSDTVERLRADKRGLQEQVNRWGALVERGVYGEHARTPYRRGGARVAQGLLLRRT